MPSAHIYKYPSVAFKFSRLAGSQVTEHAHTLGGTVNTASLNLTAGQVGSEVFCAKIFDDYIKVRIHISLLCRSVLLYFRPF